MIKHQPETQVIELVLRSPVTAPRLIGISQVTLLLRISPAASTKTIGAGRSSGSRPLPNITQHVKQAITIILLEADLMGIGLIALARSRTIASLFSFFGASNDVPRKIIDGFALFDSTHSTQCRIEPLLLCGQTETQSCYIIQYQQEVIDILFGYHIHRVELSIRACIHRGVHVLAHDDFPHILGDWILPHPHLRHTHIIGGFCSRRRLALYDYHLVQEQLCQCQILIFLMALFFS